MHTYEEGLALIPERGLPHRKTQATDYWSPVIAVIASDIGAWRRN